MVGSVGLAALDIGEVEFPVLTEAKRRDAAGAVIHEDALAAERRNRCAPLHTAAGDRDVALVVSGSANGICQSGGRAASGSRQEAFPAVPAVVAA